MFFYKLVYKSCRHDHAIIEKDSVSQGEVVALNKLQPLNIIMDCVVVSILAVSILIAIYVHGNFPRM